LPGPVEKCHSCQAQPCPLAGYDRHSIREPLACLLYDKTHRVDWSLVCGGTLPLAAGQGIWLPAGGQPAFWRTGGSASGLAASKRYAVLLHATSRASKEWPEQHWIALGEKLVAQHGLQLIIPWGNAAEQQRAERLAAAMPQAVVAPRMNLIEACGLLGHARAVIGVDTGLSHLANA
jgi:heptosyltransferase-1